MYDAQRPWTLELPDAERNAKLVLADSSEWEAVLSGIEVAPSQEVEALSRRDPDRVHSSSTARRLKPQEVVGALAKAKSRWCVRGHQDPDTERLQVYARTPVRVTSHVFPSVVVSRRRGEVLMSSTLLSESLSEQASKTNSSAVLQVPLQSGKFMQLVSPVYVLKEVSGPRYGHFSRRCTSL